HLPFTAPAKYWDLYDRSRIQVPSTKPMMNGVPYAASNWGELKAYPDIEPGQDPLSPAKSRELIHGYYACVSYMDAQVGKVLRALQKNQQRKNTIVLLWGDHGWYLGDFGDWCKHSNYEVATRVPLIVSPPEKFDVQRGAGSNAMVEFVDIFPTLTELAGLPTPSHCQGDSMMPLLSRPDRPWKEAAFSQYKKTKKGSGSMLGTSVRTKQFRYTEWRSTRSNDLDAIELVDFANDPKAMRNVASDPIYADQLEKLSELADQSGSGVRPPAR
ncbi:MAG: sulfatase/phosphatase domain-containing protein, partial [Planctomycetota bacterium]